MRKNGKEKEENEEIWYAKVENEEEKGKRRRKRTKKS